ncbi:MAG: tRNA preQ1(34) S-adenosylmethionine ribosyltransferase-isomerase QueA [Acidimicrobiales bacterium]
MAEGGSFQLQRADDFDYELPESSIAQRPIEPRDSARLLVATRSDDDVVGEAGARLSHRRVADLDRILRPGDLLVVNDTKVLAARLKLRKRTGGAVEVLLLEPTGEHGRWQALVRPGKRVAPGTQLELDGRVLATVGAVLSDGRRLVDIAPEAVDIAGQIPLPPYIHEPLADAERYQTVFARRPGSVAAPTAGLHLTDELLGRLDQRGIEVAKVELRVGLGTFRPITTELIEDHDMHAEHYSVDAEVWRRVQAADRVVAVGTTVVRTLESVARTGRLEGDTSLFIRRGFRWQVVDLLLTNFHVPRSSLLVLVDAFIGPRWRSIYREALDNGYRFLSFGDCMLLERAEAAGAHEPGIDGVDGIDCVGDEVGDDGPGPVGSR